MEQIKVVKNVRNRNIRLSTRFLGIQLFTFFFNFTGWDSVTFAIPFWGFYVLLRIYENSGICGIRVNLKIFIKFFPLLLWIILNIIQGIIYIERPRVILLMICYTVAVVFFIAFVDAKLSRIEIDFIIKMYTCLGILTTFLILTQRVNVIGTTNRFTLNVFGHNKDPNFLAAYLLFPAVYSFYNFLVNKSKKAILVFFIIGIGLLLTGSRAAIIGLALSLSIIFLCKLNRVHVLKKAMVFVIVVLIIISIMLPDEITSRFDLVSSLNDDSNHLRLRLWRAGIGIFRDHIWLGDGQNAMIINALNYGAPLAMMAHNTFIEIAAEFGLVGFLMFCFPIYNIIINAIKSKQFFILSVMSGVLFATLIISAQNAQYYWLNLALCTSMLLHKRCYK